jgi:hypothetical protein
LAAGKPDVVIAKEPALLRVKKAEVPLVMRGALDALTLIESARVAVLPDELVAEIDTGYVPVVPAAAMPEIVAVPAVALLKVRPVGKTPTSVIVGAG